MAIFSLKETALQPIGQGQPKTCEITRGFIVDEFSGKEFWCCVFELIKDGRDWGADAIWIIYDHAGRVFQIIDNGAGMSDANQEAFGSAGASAVIDPRKQSAQFGSGSKYMAIGESAWIEVVTVHKGDLKTVHAFDLSREAFIGKLQQRQAFVPTLFRKTEDSWPYGSIRASGLDRAFDHGTVLTYRLMPERAEVHPSEEELALQLTQILPETLRRIIRFNGRPLPEKEIIGTFYKFDVDGDAVLGNLHLELYRPKPVDGYVTERGILTGPHEIGEVPLGCILRHMKPEMRRRFPAELRNPEICGIITWSLLRPYSVPKRDDYKPDIKGESVALARFLRLMQQHSPLILERLRLEVPPSLFLEDDDRHRVSLAQAFTRWNRVMDPKGLGPPARPDDDDEEEDDNPDNGTVVCGPPPGGDNSGNGTVSGPGDLAARPALAIVGVRRSGEIELGETFDITFVVRDDLKSEIGPDDINLHLGNARCSDVTPPDYPKHTKRLRADELGEGEIWIEVPNQSRRASVTITVVDERQPRLNHTTATIRVGEQVRVAIVNLDKFKGKPKWTQDVPGRFEESRDRRIYTVFGTRPAMITIECVDEGNPATVLTATVEVRGVQTTDRLCIFGRWFEVDHRPIYGDRPVEIDPWPDGIPERTETLSMRWNSTAPGYQEAEQTGTAQAYIDLMIGIEWARWCHENNLDPLTGDQRPRLTLDLRDAAATLVEMQAVACKIFQLIHHHNHS